jgi:transcriptional regulator with XRE-family HTH domain
MKLASEQIQNIVNEIDRRRVGQGLSISELARRSGVHQSQVSRMLAQNFKTMSHNVMRICMTLGMPFPTLDHPRVSDADQDRIRDSAISVWNGTSADADALVELFDQIARLRRSRL